MDIAACLIHMGKSEWVVSNNVLEWKNENEPQPTDEELQAAWTEIQAEAPMKALRAKRDQLLLQTDKHALTDWPSKRNKWLAYRRALRDLPAANDPNVPFPDPPE